MSTDLYFAGGTLQKIKITDCNCTGTILTFFESLEIFEKDKTSVFYVDCEL